MLRDEIDREPMLRAGPVNRGNASGTTRLVIRFGKDDRLDSIVVGWGE